MMMNATLATNDFNEKFNSNEGANLMTSIIYPSPIETLNTSDTAKRRCWDLIASFWKSLASTTRKIWATHANDLSYEQWHRLEYRNEFAGRIGEKMNPYYIR